MIAPDDRGFALGHGLFETVLWDDHRLGHWDLHLDRLTRGCKALGLPPPDRPACRNAVDLALADAGYPHRAAVRLNWSAGLSDRGLDPPARPQPTLSSSAAKLGPPDGRPVSLIISKVRRNDRSPASRLKSLSYLDNVLARAEARAAGADEALMLNTRGKIACAASANVFWVRDGVVFTPALEAGVLDGVIRGQVLAACRRLGVTVKPRRALPVVLEDAAMFLTNSLTGVRPVRSLDGRPVPASPLVDAIARSVSLGIR